jgi:NAD+ kinase
MIIAIFHHHKKQSTEIASNIRTFLEIKGVKVVAEDEEAAIIGAEPLSSVPPESVDFIISLGGDGTILRLIHRHPRLQSPIMAINLGGLGFMADIPADEAIASLEKLLKGEFHVQSRIVIEGKIKPNTANFAVNEIVIHRAANPCLIDLAIYVDDRYLTTYSADGLIISTPNGSTAYSLAAGGPILSPELDALVLTPICPHAISNRPIVLHPERNIRIEYISEHTPLEVTYDGFPCFSMNTGEKLTITCSNRIFRLVALPDHDYFATLRNKLGWAGKLRF